MEMYEIRDQYREMLDEVYGVVEIAGCEYDTSRLLEEADPMAFDCGLWDYASSLVEDEHITQEQYEELSA